MQTASDLSAIRQLQTDGALFILFGGPQCSVCKSLRPRLQALLEQEFPAMRGIYVDCEATPDICAQYGVFSLPVVKAFIEGMQVAGEAGAFSIGQLAQSLRRPYDMWQQSRDIVS